MKLYTIKVHMYPYIVMRLRYSKNNNFVWGEGGGLKIGHYHTAAILYLP